MGNSFLNIIRQVGIFLICAQTIMHFRPKGSYEKYLKLLVSMMVLAQLLSPMLQFFGLDGGDSITVWREELNTEITCVINKQEESSKNVLEEAETMRDFLIEEEIKTRLDNYEQEESQKEESQTAEISEIVVDKIEVQ